jgi:Tfp pilus assembly protein PilW
MKKAVTLLELLISIVLLSIIVFGFANIDFFSNAQVNLASRRAKLQNEVSFALSHMAKNVSMAIGNEKIDGANLVAWRNVAGDDRTRVYIDANENGQREPPKGSPGPTEDHYIIYQLFSSGPDIYRIRYCNRCQNGTCNFDDCMDGVETLTGPYIADFNPTLNKAAGVLQDNLVTMGITACWDPATAESVDNPCVTMSSSIKMPSVSVN